MLKILFGMLIAGLVTSCDMEDPDTSGVLVDPNSDTEVPDWVSIADVDHNRDGVIDILDLVIVSKFFGQEVHNGGQTASIGNDEYIYTVLRFGKNSKGDWTSYYGTQSIQLALRLRVTNIGDVVEVKIKPIGSNPLIKTPITHSLVKYPAFLELSYPSTKVQEYMKFMPTEEEYAQSYDAIVQRPKFFTTNKNLDHPTLGGNKLVYNYVANRWIAYSESTSDAGGDIDQVFIRIDYYTHIDDEKIDIDNLIGNQLGTVSQGGLDPRDNGRTIPIQVGETKWTDRRGRQIKSGRIYTIHIGGFNSEEKLVPREVMKIHEYYRFNHMPPRNLETSDQKKLRAIMTNTTNYRCLLLQTETCGFKYNSLEVRAQYFPEDVN